MRVTRRLSFVSLAAAATVVASVAAPFAAGAAPHRPSAASAGTKQVPGVLAGLAKAHRDGLAPASRTMSIGLGVAAPDTAGEKALYASIYDPKSPNYHHFMTPAQFDAAFGVKQATRDAVTSWLTAGGLTVTSVSDDGLYVQATGTVAQLDKRFRVTIGSYADRQSGTFLANDVAPTVPASLPITVVSGLDTVQHVSTAVDQSKTYPQRLTRTAAAASAFQGVLTPENLWSVYDQPSSDEGEGQTIGIFGEGTTDPVVTQLRLFEHRFDLPKIPVQTVYTEPNVKPDLSTSAGTGGDNGGNVEWYLDAQSSTGMAPKAKELQLWFSNTLFDPDIAASISKWTATPACTSTSPTSTSINPSCAPLQMNASFGECEAGAGNDALIPLSQLPYGTELGDELEPLADPMLLKATMMGRTLFASAGDTGDGCPEVALPVVGAGNGLIDQPVPIINYPCASAYAVCVGGTVLSTDGGADADAGTTSTHNTRADEIAWQTTGGGPSHYIPEPAYQKSISQITYASSPCLFDYAGTTPYLPGTICRTTPDVAALSGNSFGNGYFIYIDGEPGSEGGTSLSSPLTMGMWARLQAASASAAGNGFANETYYKHYGTDDSTGDFFDVKCIEEDLMGADPICSATGAALTNGTTINRAGTGYDAVSGLGVPDIGKLLLAVDGTKTARLLQTDPAGPQYVASTVTLTSPDGNAQNPVVNNPVRGLPVAGGVGGTLSVLPAIDLTAATLTTSADGRTVTATVTGPGLSSTPDAQSGDEERFVLYWYDPVHKDVYYLEAETSQTGDPVYSAGDGKAGFTPITTATVTGSFTAGKLVMTAPLAALGAPAIGSELQDPAVVAQVVVPSTPATNELDLTSDSASYLNPSVQSRGDAVCVGGCASTFPVVTAPARPTGPAVGTSPTITTGTLAITGLSVLVPVVALLLVGGGAGALVLRRRRSEL